MPIRGKIPKARVDEGLCESLGKTKRIKSAIRHILALQSTNDPTRAKLGHTIFLPSKARDPENLNGVNRLPKTAKNLVV